MSALTNYGWISRNVVNFLRHVMSHVSKPKKLKDARDSEKHVAPSSEDGLRPFASSPCSMHELDPEFQQIDGDATREKVALELD